MAELRIPFLLQLPSFLPRTVSSVGGKYSLCHCLLGASWTFLETRQTSRDPRGHLGRRPRLPTRKGHHHLHLHLPPHLLHPLPHRDHSPALLPPHHRLSLALSLRRGPQDA